MKEKWLSLLALGVILGIAIGCSRNGADVGETVPGPPRELVEKSLPPGQRPPTTESPR